MRTLVKQISEQYEKCQNVCSFEPLFSQMKLEESDWKPYLPRLSLPYARNIVFRREGSFELILILWPPGAQSCIHDHAENGCCLRVLQGSLSEHFFSPSEPPKQIEVRALPCGTAATICNADGFHLIKNAAPSTPAVSLHLYAPPNYHAKPLTGTCGQRFLGAIGTVVQKSLHDAYSECSERHIDCAARLSCDVISTCCPAESPILRVDDCHPEVLYELFRKHGVSLELGARSAPHENGLLEQAFEFVSRFSVDTQHPKYFQTLWSRVDAFALGAEMLALAKHTSTYTYENAPIFTLMELEVVKKMLLLIGDWGGEGLFFPGGSAANMVALHCAALRRHPSLRREGLFGLPPFTVFCSEYAHYSVQKSAALLGWGSRSVVKVAHPPGRGMSGEDLASAFLAFQERGRAPHREPREPPILVVATAGSTVFGTFDDLPACRRFCDETGAWLHVDAAWGGAALWSQRRETWLKGVESADSLAWCAHKMMGCPLQTNVLLMREPGHLQRAFGPCRDDGTEGKKKEWGDDGGEGEVPYLFQKERFHSELNLGPLTFQCGRRPDAFKLWALIKARGDGGLANKVDKAVENAEYAAGRLRDDPRFLLLQASFANICFYWLPERLRGKADVDAMDAAERRELDALTPRLKVAMLREASAMINCQALAGFPCFFRWIFSSSLVDTHLIDAILDEMDVIGMKNF